MVDFVESMDTSDPMKPEPNGQASSQFSTLVTQGTLSPSSILKKTSPLKHITPIIKKYNCQRQAKNGKSVKLKSQGKKAEEVKWLKVIKLKCFKVFFFLFLFSMLSIMPFALGTHNTESNSCSRFSCGVCIYELYTTSLYF